MSLVLLIPSSPDKITLNKAEQQQAYLLPASPDKLVLIEDKECGEVTVLNAGAGPVVVSEGTGCGEMAILDGGFGKITLSKGDGQPGGPGIPGPAAVWEKEFFTIDTLNLSNGYIDLSNIPIEESLSVFRNGVNETEWTLAVFRITWTGARKPRLGHTINTHYQT